MEDTTPSPGFRPRWAVIARAVLGAAAVVVAIATTAMTWPTLTVGHPAYPVVLAGIGLSGLVLLARSARPRRPGRLRAAGRVAGAAVLLMAFAVVLYLRPFPAQDEGVAAAASTDTVEVVQSWDAWELRPRGEAGDVGLVFLPGMLVDPRAHFPLLKPLAQSGVHVVVPTAPLGLALTGPQVTAQAIESEPDIDTWIVGGHSMGGAAAASVAASEPEIDGLLIWASYSSNDLSGSDVEVLSVYGTNDPFADDRIIDDTRAMLPPDTRYAAIDGGVHADFGDYIQYGDGEPGTDRATAQRRIVEETQAFVNALRRG